MKKALKSTLLALALALIPLTSLAGAEERKFITVGMTEAEVLVKIGKPDSKSYDSGGGSRVAVRRWIYLPAPGDDQTATTVVISKGTVISVTREIARR